MVETPPVVFPKTASAVAGLLSCPQEFPYGAHAALRKEPDEPCPADRFHTRFSYRVGDTVPVLSDFCGDLTSTQNHHCRTFQ